MDIDGYRWREMERDGYIDGYRWRDGYRKRETAVVVPCRGALDADITRERWVGGCGVARPSVPPVQRDHADDPWHHNGIIMTSQ